MNAHEHSSSSPLVQIQGAEIQRITYQGECVVTFAQVDAVHQRPEGTAGRTFRDNRGRFIEGEDFISEKLDVLRRGFPGALPTRGGGDVMLLTKRGYLKLVKPMTDDRAWAVQGEMIDRYFATKQDKRALTSANDPRETRLQFRQNLMIAKLVGLSGNQAAISANRATRAATGFDTLAAMGIAMPSPVNDVMVNPSTLGDQLGLSAVKVNQHLHNMGFQLSIKDTKGRTAWHPTNIGKDAGGQMMDVDRSNGTGAAQQLRWPSSVVDLIRSHLNAGAA